MGVRTGSVYEFVQAVRTGSEWEYIQAVSGSTYRQ